ncbi:Mpv17 / PMP22 family [Musa troglodytarum]|uniref:Mpv17 / PMP22 family n=1 Tax=Musa troglodytarum TaxID=320322 RepID=A0A9E7H6R8_9LILI|nr:Mpv17 / PMP22 family [Musa troglodytarum]
MLKLWRWYQNCLAVHPVRTQMVSSAFLWGLGDIGAQVVTQRTLWHQSQDKKEENKEINIDWRRVATTSMFGFAFVGPIGHYWYEYLDRIIQVRLQLQPKSMKFVTSKVAADGLIFGPLDLLIFFSYMGLTSGRSISQVKEDVKRDFLPALIIAPSCLGSSNKGMLLGSSGLRLSDPWKIRRARADNNDGVPFESHHTIRFAR